MSARVSLFRSDDSQAGGPRFVAGEISEPCLQNPGVCLVLLEPIRDIMKASGDQTNPYVYAVAATALYGAAKKFGSLAALNAAYDQYTANNVDAALPAALDILRMMLASSRSLKADDPNDYRYTKVYEHDATVAAMGASIAGEFSDASRFLEKDMKDSLEDSKDQGRTVALAETLTERARDVDTLARLGRAYQRTDLPPTDATRIALMKDIGTVARTVWPRRLDAAGHGVWDPRRRCGRRPCTSTSRARSSTTRRTAARRTKTPCRSATRAWACWEASRAVTARPAVIRKGILPRIDRDVTESGKW